MSKKNQNVEVNEFDETIAASKNFFEKHMKPIVYGTTGVIALIIAGLLLYQFYITPRNERANEALFPAQQLFAMGNYETALNGDSLHLGFLAVEKQFSCTDAADLAGLYAGLCYAQMGQYQDAIDKLKDFSDCGDEMVSPAVISTLGNCYAQLGQNDKAVQLLVKAAAEADNSALSPRFLVQAAQLYESMEQKDKALDCYMQIKKKYQQSPEFMEIDKYLEHLK